ncbi:MAG: hypothetical protein HZB46_12375 [Solirubrobacterales bacterium]|nr:hypothetical protein [Solirubrobacterales bacterium]
MDDPWVMYYVVRKDVPLTVEHAMALAGAAAVRCRDRFADDPDHREAFAAWHERPRKVALRASAGELERFGGVLLETEAGPTLRALPPCRRSSAPEHLAALRPYTDPPRKGALEAPGARPALRFVTREGVLRTTGKAMAQAGHAALLAAEELAPRHPEAFAAWRAAGCPAVLEVVDAERWEAVRADPDAVVVADAGLTQVAPGTETVAALPPR